MTNSTLLYLSSLALLAGTATAQTFTEPPMAVDIDPDPNVVEINLTADVTTHEFIPGVTTNVWAYNGSIPGPTIVANVGDTVKVNFTNNLPEATTIHWHGVDIPADMDGSHISQPHVAASGGTYTYQFTALNDGMHWYHPHVRTFDQVEKGLHGVFIIRNPARETLLGLDTIEEHVMVFDDVLLDGSNEIVPAFSFTDPLQNAIYHLNGREGNLLLVNGKDASQAVMHVPNGEPQRWRVLNAANTTFCRLDLRDSVEGLDETIWKIGTDQGFINEPFALFDVTNTAPGPDHPGQALVGEMGQGVLLLPGERMDVVFTPIGSDGQSFKVYQSDWYRGRHVAFFDTAGNIQLGPDPVDGNYPNQQFLEIVTQGPDPGNGEHVLPTKLRNFPNWNVQAQGVLPVTFGHGNPDSTTGAVTLFAQAEMVMGPSGMMMNPLPAPKITSLKAHDVEVGDVWRWEITNLTAGDHPFHTHGFKFELIEYEFKDSVTPTNNWKFTPQVQRQYKDVIRCPPRLGAKGSSSTITRLRMVFDDTGREGLVASAGGTPTYDPLGDFVPGGWLFHCHVLEHSGKGMLSFYELRDPADTYQMLGNHFDSSVGKASLTATGDLSPGSTLTLEVVNALPNADAIVLLGNFPGNRTIRGVTAVPGISHNGTTLASSPRWRSFVTTIDGAGRLTFNNTSWESAPSGMELYWQVAFKDLSLPGEWAITNALKFTRP